MPCGRRQRRLKGSAVQKPSQWHFSETGLRKGLLRQLARTWPSTKIVKEMWQYEIAIEDGHLLVLVDGQRALFDTGSPQSIGEGHVEFCGRSYALAGSTWAGTIDSLRELAGLDFDMLIGGDLLAGHVVDIGPHGRSLTIDGPAPSNGFESISLELVMNLPIVGIEVAGQRVSAALDTGARISFAHANLLAGRPRIGEREDFYPGLGRFTAGLHRSELQLGGMPVLWRLPHCRLPCAAHCQHSE